MQLTVYNIFEEQFRVSHYQKQYDIKTCFVLEDYVNLLDRVNQLLIERTRRKSVVSKFQNTQYVDVLVCGH